MLVPAREVNPEPAEAARREKKDSSVSSCTKLVQQLLHRVVCRRNKRRYADPSMAVSGIGRVPLIMC